MIFPINISKLALLLKKLLNRPFVDSILRGLKEGFWPMSSLPSDETIIHANHASGPEAEEIMEKAKNKERSFDRYSEPFNALSPGIKVAPICLAETKWEM